MSRWGNAMMKSGMLMMLMAGALMAAPVVYGEEEISSRRVMAVDGEVAQVDWVGSRIVISPDNGNQILFHVPKNAQITRGIEKISLSDLEAQDRVSVAYYIDPEKGPVIIRLDDTNLANM
ncbi:MAG: hypothetical protein PHN49_10480 [Candidatus Omnitrophica bacterium]|nr:hypothetical protein [Candidatus Omnitrophota bacterium]MDD5672055.1 hypothetical protein [Candidatus Omnitrophota bacterium]